MAIIAIISLVKCLDVSKYDNGVSKNGVYEPFSYRFSNVFVDKNIGAATVLYDSLTVTLLFSHGYFYKVYSIW